MKKQHNENPQIGDYVKYQGKKYKVESIEIDNDGFNITFKGNLKSLLHRDRGAGWDW